MGQPEEPAPEQGGEAALFEPSRLAALTATGLGATPDRELDELARHLRDRLGTPAVVVSLVSEREQVFPGLAGLGEPWASTRRTPLAESVCRYEIATGAPLVVADTSTDPRLRHHPATYTMGIRTYAGFPLFDDENHVLGALCALGTEARVWHEDELRVLAEAAHQCTLVLRLRIARRAARAERARTDAAEALLRAALERSQLLLTASQSLADASDLRQIRAAVSDLTSGELKPTYVGLTLTEGAARLHRIDDPLQSVGPEPGAEVYGIDDDSPVARSAREGRLHLYQDPEAIAAAFSQPARSRYSDLGLRSVACAPMRDADEVIGVLLFGWDKPHTVDLIEQVVITTLASYVAHALERMRFLEQRITVARQMQEAMLTTLPTVPGLRLGTRYLAATTTEQVGGDWYDAISLAASPSADHDTVALSVGDITGHDIHAANLMGQVRSMGRQATWERPAGPPSSVLTAVEDACAATGIQATGTMLQAHLRPADGSVGAWHMRWASAGHLPPVVRHADGSSTVLERGDLLFGYPELRLEQPTDHDVLLHPGDTVLLYTDGLVERRSESIDAGIDRLREALAELTADNPQRLVDHCIQRLAPVDGDYTDDVVLLAVHLPVLGTETHDGRSARVA